MNLPRFHIEGHIYYITTVIYNRLPIFTRPSFIIPLYDSLNFYRYKQEFKLLGYLDFVHLTRAERVIALGTITDLCVDSPLTDFSSL